MAKGQIFNGLPVWAKGIIALAVVGGVGFIAFKIYKKSQDLVGKKDVKAVENESLTEVDKLTQQGQKLSKPIPAYQTTINDIVTKLNGCEDIRTEGAVIEAIIRVVKKPIDWHYLVAKFKNKDIADCGSFGMSKTNYDLPTLLNDQLDTGGFMAINVDGFKRSSYYNNSITLLKEYFSTIGVTL